MSNIINFFDHTPLPPDGQLILDRLMRIVNEVAEDLNKLHEPERAGETLAQGLEMIAKQVRKMAKATERKRQKLIAEIEELEPGWHT